MARVWLVSLFVVLLAVALPAGEAQGCDCPLVSVEESWDRAGAVFVARVLETDSGTALERLAVLEGTVAERLDYGPGALSNCFPWAPAGEAVLVFLVDGQVPSICTNSGQVLGHLRSGFLVELLDHAGATQTVTASALELALSGESMFFGAMDKPARLALVFPELAGTTLAVDGHEVHVVASAADAPQHARVLTVDAARSRDELALVVLRHAAEGMVLRALLRTGEAPLVLARELVEQ